MTQYTSSKKTFLLQSVLSTWLEYFLSYYRIFPYLNAKVTLIFWSCFTLKKIVALFFCLLPLTIRSVIKFIWQGLIILCEAMHCMSYTLVSPGYSLGPTSSRQLFVTAILPHGTLRRQICTNEASTPNHHKFLGIWTFSSFSWF